MPPSVSLSPSFFSFHLVIFERSRFLFRGQFSVTNDKKKNCFVKTGTMSLVRSDRAQFIPPEKSKSKHIYVCDKRAEGKKCAEFLLIMSLSFHRVFSFSFVCICVCVYVCTRIIMIHRGSSSVWMALCRWNNGVWHSLHIIKQTLHDIFLVHLALFQVETRM